MNLDQGWQLRLAVLSTLVKRAPVKPGRTTLMKLAYLLETVRNVPLGYRFELYNYGPFDSTVVSDISQAVTLKAIKSQVVYFSSGYGYEYSSHESGHADVCGKVADEIRKYDNDIDWVLAEFGSASASRLELISTIVFAEREMRRKQQDRSRAELRIRVERIKPHFSAPVIDGAIDDLSEQGLIDLSSQ